MVPTLRMCRGAIEVASSHRFDVTGQHEQQRIGALFQSRDVLLTNATDSPNLRLHKISRLA